MIRIHNDGKGKLHSWEAHLPEDFVYDGCINLSGYGHDEYEAIEALKDRVRKAIDELQDLDYSMRIRVNHRQEPLKDAEPYGK